MEQITRGVARGEAVRVGVDLAKRVIQVHAVNVLGEVLTTRALPRDRFTAWCAQLPAGCTVAMETSSSSHHWARKLGALGLDARIIAAQLVSPYRRQGASGEAPAGIAATGDPLFCRDWTLLGLPCIHLPFSRGHLGLPMGLQLVGRRGQDHQLLACAQWVHERLTR